MSKAEKLELKDGRTVVIHMEGKCNRNPEARYLQPVELEVAEKRFQVAKIKVQVASLGASQSDRASQKSRKARQGLWRALEGLRASRKK